MAKENIELHIIHNPKLTTEDNGFAIAIFIDGVDKSVLELSQEQMLHIGAILLNASRKFINNADKTKKIEQKPAWSEEDAVMLNNVIDTLKPLSQVTHSGYAINSMINWLKPLRPQNNITDEELAQAKKEAYNDALNKIEYHNGELTFDDGWSAAIWYLKNKNLSNK